MFDKIEKIGQSTVQHGPHNDRVYLMDLHPSDTEHIIEDLTDLAILKRYSKIFAKVPEKTAKLFRDHEFKLEATIPDYYSGGEAACFVSQFFTAKRSYLSKKKRKEIEKIKTISIADSGNTEIQLPKDAILKTLTAKDVGALAELYRKVFEVYPFPIFDEDYLTKTMKTNVMYFGIFMGNQLVASSSAEMDRKHLGVEMTDFATHPQHLGQNLSYLLLTEMEKRMKQIGINTCYTIARAHSYGMNKTFGKANYKFGGTLVNNTLIGASIESMNIWYKNIQNQATC